MSDEHGIVERLRKLHFYLCTHDQLTPEDADDIKEAAARIEELERERDRAIDERDDCTRKGLAKMDEINRLEAEVERLTRLKHDLASSSAFFRALEKK